MSEIVPDHIYKLAKLFEEAQEEGKEDEILNFIDDKDRTAFHMAARNGQPVTLEWCIQTWKRFGK